ncbi:MAG TPA: hypothetical protein VI911_09920 [Patescibacteria group bacterium]|nr:hypothetical protein [Patescibacteria group bacterium]
MAVEERRSCDICGTYSKTITVTMYDNEYHKVVNTTDLCEAHFNLLRSYLRHGCPQVSRLPLPGEEPIYIPNRKDRNGLVDVQDCQR